MKSVSTNPQSGCWQGLLCAVGLVLVLGVVVSISGCKAAGVLAYKVMGPPPIEPKYVPSPEPMVVLVERYNATGALTLESETLAREIYRDLVAHKVGQQIDPVLAMDLRSRDPAKFKKMTISQIGAAVTAKQVLYVNILGRVESAVDGGAIMRGQMSARVKIVDVETGQLRWPVDAAEGYPVKADMPMTATGQDITTEGFRTEMIRSMATSIGRLFYKYQYEDEAPRDEL